MKGNMAKCCSVFYLLSFLLIIPSVTANSHAPTYDSSANSQCKAHPEGPLYHGGILKDQEPQYTWIKGPNGTSLYSPAFNLQNLKNETYYCFSTWIKTNVTGLAMIKASLITETTRKNCTGTVLAQSGCWSFLKGGFELDSPSNSSFLYFQNSEGRNIDIKIANTALQPFSKEEWRLNQEHKINKERKREVIIHVSNQKGETLEGAEVTVTQKSKEFPFGSAISANIIGNLPYQKWFTERFNAAVFENELKWYATEAKRGVLNYTLADQMLEFVRANQILARGHNIFWENPLANPKWVPNLSNSELYSAVNSRIKSLLERYKEQFVHWDVNNEMLHFDFYEQRLGPNASLSFFQTAQKTDPLATLFLNDFNIVETCDDAYTTVDAVILKMRELKRGGITMGGIGLEAHFDIPNLPLMRAILDKLGTLGLPIWLTEVDIKKALGQKKQALHLEEVLREGFSHPSVNGIMLWSALDPKGCYEMCLTDSKFENLPAGDVVDRLLKEWNTGVLKGKTDDHGSFIIRGFFGEFEVSARFGDKVVNTTFCLSKGDETRHFSIQI